MKTFRLFSMAALALAMAACSNDDNEILQNTQQPGTMHFTATIAAPSGDATTRTVYTEEGTTINVKWKVGDNIALVHNGVVDVAEVKTVDDVTGKATIEADITGSPSDNDDVYLAYPADAVYSATPYSPFPFTPNSDIFDKVKNYQDGTLEYIQNNLDLRMGSGKLAVNGSDVSLKESVSVPSLICIWKLTLQDESSNALSATKLTFKNNTYTQAKATSAAKSVYYLCVVPSFIPDPTGTFSFEATVGSDTYTFSKTGLSLTAGKYYQSTVTMAEVVDPNLLSGIFSVSSTKKVKFSKGNLRYASGTWSFFDNQYDYYTSYSADAWDKFGWSTSATTYGMNTSTSNSTYSGDFKDWGDAVGSGWRTLTGGSDGEWAYLFNTRTTGGTVFGTAQARYAHATINTDGTGVNGMILFPDGVDIASTEVTTAGSVNAKSNWATKCTTAQWSALAAKGCVFLPAAGYRYGTSVDTAGSDGRYWSSSPYGADYAYRVYFSSGGLDPAYNNDRGYGFSVRLVRQVE